MKILIPVLNFGKAGGYRVLSKLADELIYLGHSVNFMSPETSTEPYYPTKASVKWIDYNGDIIKDAKKEPALKESGLSIFQKLTKGLKKLPKDAYDVIIANHSLTIFPIKKAGLTHKILYYVQAYEPDFYNSPMDLKNRILCQLYSRSYKMNLFTVVNAGIYLNYKKLKASRVLYPGIDFKLFYPKEKNILEQRDNKVIIGTVGRMIPSKGTQYVVDAFQKLKQEYSSIELHVAFGDPDDFKNYEGIHCFQPHGDEALANFYRTLDYYFCAGYVQLGAFHYPVAEAMSCGVPVISTLYYPANETNAWLTRPRNTDEIVSQFRSAHSNSSLKEKKVQQALMDVQQFDWKLVGKRLNNYLNEFLQNSEIAKK